MSEHRPFAVVTGASRGIGAAYARVLAQNGYDVFLVARNRDRLAQVARSLESTHGITAYQESLDLAQNGSAKMLFDRTMAFRRPIALVIHNAGFGLYGNFCSMSHPDILNMVNLHMTHVTESMRLFLPQLITQGGGAIINVASVAGFLPIAYMAEYAATKAYLIAISEALSREVRSSGVTLQVCCPGYTETDFHATAGHRPRHVLFPQSPDQVAAVSLKALETRKTVVTIGWQGRLAYWSARWLPRSLVVSMAETFVKPPTPSS